MAVGLTFLVFTGVLFLAWLITLIVLGVTMINVFEITEDDITLKNISVEFADAYRQQTRSGMRPTWTTRLAASGARPGGRSPTTIRGAADGRTLAAGRQIQPMNAKEVAWPSC